MSGKSVLLLIFVHGFMGSNDSFCDFPLRLKEILSTLLSDYTVQSIVYPTYKTRKDLTQAVEAFNTWLVSQIRAIYDDNALGTRKNIKIILIGHSMGGLLIGDSAVSLHGNMELANLLNSDMLENKKNAEIKTSLNDKTDYNNLIVEQKLADSNGSTSRIVGVIAFDTPYYGISHEAISQTVVKKALDISKTVDNTKKAGFGLLNDFKSLWNQTANNTTNNSRSPKESSPELSFLDDSMSIFSKSRSATRENSKSPKSLGPDTKSSPRSDPVAISKQESGRLSNSLKLGIFAAGAFAAVGLATAAYINKDKIGEGSQFISEHICFVGSLYKQDELQSRVLKLTSKTMVWDFIQNGTL
ncbi:hypothetical protein BB559_004294 [Furculomyces boomerangus]|uniref:DUF676 domain-containing protein n=1 Tax=Furculomyces boomerangus TaxID=61424 RepID=A0A2T9Y9C6_9FUNG|nr:hypothetical protein BB559_005312 [Furculomyces boomerangus]PVU91079.1 hypothetical protein BB559_004294 [Furculomyces boomerangus]